MTREQIYARIEKMIKDRRGESFQVTPTMDIREDLGADSVDLMEFIIGLEDEFGIEITDLDADGFTGLDDVVAFIAEKKK